ncbi:hypothetical protein [uncultured Kordia sp.]|uniref:hypothetical protein n=1 Tax=uncultured Kordia sp. TaxID=507699 RepID=UPI002603634C|nr:hypothetical protein [uncultured Kordia sp.]
MVFILAYINPELHTKELINFNNQKYYVSVEDAKSSLATVKKLAMHDEKYLRIIPVYLT